MDFANSVDWTEDERCPYLRGVPEAEWADRAAEAGAAAARAWQDPTAWEGEAPFGGGSMPAAVIGSMMTSEFVLHGWDVARATGQSYTVPEPVATTALTGVEAIAGMGRDGGWFAAEVEDLARIYILAVAAGRPVLLDEEEMARNLELFRGYGQAGKPRR